MADTSPVALLSEIIAQSSKVSAKTYGTRPAYGALRAAGLLRDRGLIQSVLCDACDIGHDAPVLFEGGAYGHVCPQSGFVSLDRSDLIAAAPDFEILARQIAAALDCVKRKPRAIGGQTWHIGTVRTETADVAVYFHTRLQTKQDLYGLEMALRAQVRATFGLVLTAQGSLVAPGMTTAPLDQVFGFDEAQGAMEAATDVATLVGAPVVRKGGRPELHGERIRAIIADQTATGRMPKGWNANIKAVQDDYAARFPDDPKPSRSTVGRHLSVARGGS